MRRALFIGRTLSCSRGFHSSLYSAKIVVEKVPALGESITEGSIASWAKKEGDAVAVDDVIVIVETDKVTVDIKSTFAGVFKKKLVTDNVVVGQPLYEIDVDATAAPSSSPAPSTAAPAAKAPVKADTATHEHGRVPLIKFLGKRDKTKKAQPSTTATSTPAAAPSTPAFKPLKEGNGVHFTTLKGAGQYGRPPITQKEIDAIESGGAIF
eukprot:gene37120-42039_t